jgi:hypothetical protein
LQEEFVQVRVTANGGPLPAVLPFSDVVSCERDAQQALVVMKNPGAALQSLCAPHGLTAQVLPLAFDDIYRLVIDTPREQGGAR